MKGLVQLSCLKTVARISGFSVREFDLYGNLFELSKGPRKLFFANFSTPWNSGSVEQICKDKGFTYFILKDVVLMPETIGYFDPDFKRDGYGGYKKFNDVGVIADDITHNFPVPLVVKRNSGMRGVNVFLCRSSIEVERALTKIFFKDSPDYDYVALAQTYITPKAEYRAVIFRGKVVLLYEKDISKAEFKGNISPLHFEGARAVEVKDGALKKEIEGFLSPVFRVLPIDFAGFDVILDASGRWWLIEINTRPGFAIFIRDNGKEPIIKMYETILKSLI